MDGHEGFEPTHRIIATGERRVAACKNAVSAFLLDQATEIRVLIHPAEQRSAPELIEKLENVKQDEVVFAESEAELRGAIPDVKDVVDGILDGMDRDGRIPVTALCFRGEGFDAAISSSTSHSHVGSLYTVDTTLVEKLDVVLSGIGVIVSARPTIGWKQDGKYIELVAHELCVYAEQPSSDECRRSTTHSCYDLTDLIEIQPYRATKRIELKWRTADSIHGWLLQTIFGEPPTELLVTADEFDAVAEYLSRFLSDS